MIVSSRIFVDHDELPPRSNLSGIRSDCFYESDSEGDTILSLMCMNTLKLENLIPMSVFSTTFDILKILLDTFCIKTCCKQKLPFDILFFYNIINIMFLIVFVTKKLFQSQLNSMVKIKTRVENVRTFLG